MIKHSSYEGPKYFQSTVSQTTTVNVDSELGK